MNRDRPIKCMACGDLFPDVAEVTIHIIGRKDCQLWYAAKAVVEDALKEVKWTGS